MGICNSKQPAAADDAPAVAATNRSDEHPRAAPGVKPAPAAGGPVSPSSANAPHEGKVDGARDAVKAKGDGAEAGPLTKAGTATPISVMDIRIDAHASPAVAAVPDGASVLLTTRSTPPPALTLERRRVDERYEIGRELGRGCFGVVYVCREKSTGQEWALKMLSKSALKNAATVHDEVRQLRTVGAHPNVVQLHDFFEDPSGAYYIVMEYCKGGDLFTRIVNQGSYSEATASHLLRQLASAIQHMHRNKIAHRSVRAGAGGVRPSATETRPAGT